MIFKKSTLKVAQSEKVILMLQQHPKRGEMGEKVENTHDLL
jgi:hypothetical protein